MKIILAMTTYNRKNILEKTISSLLKIKNIEKFDIRIYDDKSSEFDKEYLKRLIPIAKKIEIREANYKADKNMYYIHREFYESDADYLFQVDSDMLFHKDLYSIIEKVIKSQKEGLFTFYNSCYHEVLPKSRKVIDNIEFIEKKDIGGACVLFSKKIIKEIIENVKIKNEDYTEYDYRWSHYLYNKKIPIYSTKESFLQHIGLIGQNNDGIKIVDIGLGFNPTNEKDKEFLLKHYEKITLNLLEKQKKYIYVDRKYIPKGLIKLIKKVLKKIKVM